MSEVELTQYETPKSGDRIVGGSFVFVAIRCTLQYVVLPFMLPFIGLADNFSVVLSTIIEVVALGMIGYNLVHLWDTNWRKRYIVLSAISGTLILIFLYTDIQYLAAL
jgi:hypothetical protein